MFAHSLRRFVTPVALFLPPTFSDSAFAQSSLKRGGLERGVIRTRSGRTVVTGPATEWLSCLPAASSFSCHTQPIWRRALSTKEHSRIQRTG
jgi:hypothetical protein